MKALPNADELISESGILNDQTRLYLLQLGQLLRGEIRLTMPRYADRDVLDAAIPNPVDNEIAGTVVTAIGLVMRIDGDWVDSNGDSVPIVPSPLKED